MLRPAFHLIAALHFWFSAYYDWFYVNVPVHVHPMGKAFGNTNKLKFLTYWDEVLQAFFFSVCFLNDILGCKQKTKGHEGCLQKFKDYLQTCLAFPISFFVGLTFWAIYFVDRELVLPRAVDQYFPWWLNQCVHTNIMVFILIEMFISQARYPPKKIGYSVLTVFMLVYLVWIHVIHAYTNMWVYPVLDVLNMPLRIVFFLSLLALSLALYTVGEKLNGCIWSKKRSTKYIHLTNKKD
ncbi:PREDICTED: androgen-induced gene 1 protein-like isoform X2 [Nicrophorus vespilloides]|uniref:Androgen-induced gene 1 protein-like isoform X2 n=1 Tax=Nicrophorus vespilloides TaxID=110193 RepID=A0ABM1NI64_NICVS|nr:PREDICTED: androgen-induced gene 1 protein-like isoform X2 [Nicrophorus vespilloides]